VYDFSQIDMAFSTYFLNNLIKEIIPKIETFRFTSEEKKRKVCNRESLPIKLGKGKPLSMFVGKICDLNNLINFN
jgi:hypothetical protein